MSLPNFRHPIDHSETPQDLNQTVKNMLSQADLLDVYQMWQSESYAKLAQRLHEEGDQIYNLNEYGPDLDNVIYWLECAHKRLINITGGKDQ